MTLRLKQPFHMYKLRGVVMENVADRLHWLQVLMIMG